MVFIFALSYGQAFKMALIGLWNLNLIGQLGIWWKFYTLTSINNSNTTCCQIITPKIANSMLLLDLSSFNFYVPNVLFNTKFFLSVAKCLDLCACSTDVNFTHSINHSINQDSANKPMGFKMLRQISGHLVSMLLKTYPRFHVKLNIIYDFTMYFFSDFIVQKSLLW